MSDPGKAVFLSYASQDAEAAKRICEALRAAGIEVWFDQSELRGGDAWDQKIRRQIKECALFMPVISANTNARPEGYFRLEWKLAVDRSHLMADDAAFLFPIVIGDVSDSAARVPDKFRDVQWTRLPGALATPEFVTQVKRLLERRGGPVAQASAATPGKSSKSWLMPVIAAVIVAAGLAFVMLRKPAAVEAPAGKLGAVAAAPAAPVNDKSIAVLPFSNMSEDKDNAFFADGIHEDILTNLALVRAFRVVSRTSVLPYRNSGKAMRQIAQELGVTYILEGSVRRIGNKVRVTGQLIHAATDEHVWAQAYDRDLTDVFTIQSELSQQIAGALKTALSPEEKVRIARQPTQNPAAYDLYLHARDVLNREGRTVISMQKQITLLQNAVELDPNFAEAWGELADAEAYMAFAFLGDMEEARARGKAAIERAVKLAPDEPEVIRSLGTFFYYGYRDYPKATEQYQRLAQLLPNAPSSFYALALIQRRQGNWAQSAVYARRAVELDPANANYLRDLSDTLSRGNHWDEATVVQKKLVALLPDQLLEKFALVSMPYLTRGSFREMDDFVARLSREEAESPDGIEIRRNVAGRKGDWAEVIRQDRLQPYYEKSGGTRAEQATDAALAYYASGDRAGAIARLGDIPGELRRLLAADPKNARNWASLALMEAMLGHPEEAVRCADRAVESLPESVDAYDGPSYTVTRATVYDWTGDKERALAEYARLIRMPGAGMSVYGLKYGYSTLHGDLRFEALLNDPKNSAPLF